MSRPFEYIPEKPMTLKERVEDNLKKSLREDEYYINLCYTSDTGKAYGRCYITNLGYVLVGNGIAVWTNSRGYPCAEKVTTNRYIIKATSFSPEQQKLIHGHMFRCKNFTTIREEVIALFGRSAMA